MKLWRRFFWGIKGKVVVRLTPGCPPSSAQMRHDHVHTVDVRFDNWKTATVALPKEPRAARFTGTPPPQGPSTRCWEVDCHYSVRRPLKRAERLWRYFARFGGHRRLAIESALVKEAEL